MSERATIKKLLGEVFDAAREGLRESLDDAAYEEQRREFVFHMTDWLSDLGRLRELLANAEGADKDEACTQVIGFLYHAVPHLNAAGRLLLDEIRDPFAAAGSKGKNGAASTPPGLTSRSRARKKV